AEMTTAAISSRIWRGVSGDSSNPPPEPDPYADKNREDRHPEHGQNAEPVHLGARHRKRGLLGSLRSDADEPLLAGEPAHGIQQEGRVSGVAQRAVGGAPGVAEPDE